ncbi:hypothetical protein I533_16095 [Alteromonas mediterranea MED64]|uniref:hypothetical protein n=1 Tax=Alteromonas mediterranea TaxID=314275 RepID=UPI00035568B2|nr:hypothetical protein [Alteromonas mediterranea]AGP83170.1 hypothetical protein I533_16095 [Alteromonas mediterranea MED64]
MKNTRSTLMLTALLSSALLSHSAMADDSIDHSGKASKHSVLAASEGLATTASVASAVVAVPVVLTGSVVVAESAVVESARNLHQASHQSSVAHDQPLVITETIITADPAPNQVVTTKTKVITTTTNPKR